MFSSQYRQYNRHQMMHAYYNCILVVWDRRLQDSGLMVSGKEYHYVFPNVIVYNRFGQCDLHQFAIDHIRNIKHNKRTKCRGTALCIAHNYNQQFKPACGVIEIVLGPTPNCWLSRKY